MVVMCRVWERIAVSSDDAAAWSAMMSLWREKNCMPWRRWSGQPRKDCWTDSWDGVPD